MEWAIAGVAVVVIALATLAAAGKLGEMPDVEPDTPGPVLPEGRLSGDDVRGAHFGVAIRGYDMAQVDRLLGRVADQLDAVPSRSPDGESDPLSAAVPGDAE